MLPQSMPCFISMKMRYQNSDRVRYNSRRRRICTWNESTGTVVFLKVSGRMAWVIWKKEIFSATAEVIWITIYDTVYQIQDGQFVKVAEGKTDGAITDGTISYTYTWNGETVDEAAYKSSLDGVIDLDQLIRPYSSTVERNEIISQIRAK